MKITLKEWDAKNFSKTHHINTLRLWAKQGYIVPKPELIGNKYWCKEDAKYIQIENNPEDINDLDTLFDSWKETK